MRFMTVPARRERSSASDRDPERRFGPGGDAERSVGRPALPRSRPGRVRRRALRLALLAALALPLACGRQASVETDPRGAPGTPTPTPVPAAAPSVTALYPGATWARVDAPERVGFSSAKLAELREYVESLNTTGMMAVVGGRVLFEHGHLDSLSYLASVRKSVLAMLYGNYVANGTIDLERTLAQLGTDDVDGLLPTERRATIRHLITARSGVYHPASNAGDNSADAPPRGSQEPGDYYLYNNWDFNAAGAIFEQLTGRDIYDALQTDLAEPLQFQDFDRARQRKSGNTRRSRNLAYHMWLSTRDMARLGYLMLRDGAWRGRQVIPADWARRIRSVVTPSEEMNPESRRGGELGYGYMWWVWDGPDVPDWLRGAYTASGAYGQYITVVPSLDLVVAHKTAVPPERQTPWRDYREILARLAAAHCGAAC